MQCCNSGDAGGHYGGKEDGEKSPLKAHDVSHLCPPCFVGLSKYYPSGDITPRHGEWLVCLQSCRCGGKLRMCDCHAISEIGVVTDIFCFESNLAPRRPRYPWVGNINTA